VAQGTTLVGSPDTVAKGIQRLLGYSDGGFGGILFRAHEWANREQTMRSYELFARYVMPRFQGSLDTIVGSNEWARANRKAVFGPTVAAVKKAFTDVGREVPDEFRQRTVGARDVTG
jgi:limonene 1,2-monooxygenase